jgi:SPP1 gp7 family putative phage head morphogenesis protein
MNSQDYWRKREEKWIAQQIKDDAKQSKVIVEKYQRALDQIEKEISANWERFTGKEGVTLSEAKKMAYEMDVKAFARKAKQYVKDKDFSKTANDELRLYNVTMRVNRLELLKSQIGLELIALSDDVDKYTAETLTKTGLKEAERQAGILSETVFSNYKTFVESVAFGSFQGATFSERIWGNNQALKADLDRLLVRSITQGKNPRELARELRNIFDSSKYEAERLMRTETARVQISVQEKSYKEYGIDEFEYIAEPSACDSCKPLNGKIFKTKDMIVALNAPPMHPNCRCSTAPYVERGKASSESNDFKDVFDLSLIHI